MDKFKVKQVYPIQIWAAHKNMDCPYRHMHMGLASPYAHGPKYAYGIEHAQGVR